MNPADIKLERRPGEPAVAFAAFQVWAFLGSQRTMTAASVKLGKSRQVLGVWHKRHSWASRVLAYDGLVAEAQRAAVSLVETAESGDIAERRRRVRLQEWKTSEKLLAMADRILATLVPAKASAADVCRMLDLSNRLARSSAGMAIVTTESHVEQTGTIKVEIEAALARVYGGPAAERPALAAPAAQAPRAVAAPPPTSPPPTSPPPEFPPRLAGGPGEVVDVEAVLEDAKKGT